MGNRDRERRSEEELSGGGWFHRPCVERMAAAAEEFCGCGKIKVRQEEAWCSLATVREPEQWQQPKFCRSLLLLCFCFVLTSEEGPSKGAQGAS